MVGKLNLKTDYPAHLFSCFDHEHITSEPTSVSLFASITLGLDVYRLRIMDIHTHKLVWETTWPLSEICTCLSMGTMMEDSVKVNLHKT